MYSIAKAVEIIPYVSLIILWIIFAITHVSRSDNFVSMPTGFTQPSGDGYEYYLSAQRAVYISQKGNHFKVYLLKGPLPSAVRTKYDRYGQFFTLPKANNFADAERLIDQVFEQK